jgi:hypothetical protein
MPLQWHLAQLLGCSDKQPAGLSCAGFATGASAQHMLRRQNCMTPFCVFTLTCARSPSSLATFKGMCDTASSGTAM